jgi:hypothetical protein
MRKHLIAGTAALALSFSAISTPAHADIVFDPAAFAQHAKQNAMEWVQWGKEVVQMGKEAAHWVSELAWYKRQWDTMVTTYNALTSITDLQSAAWAVGGLTRNFYPDANVIPELMSDTAQLWGRAGSWNSYDLAYQSQIMDKWSWEMERRMGVTSNTKAMAESSSWNAQQHMSTLEILNLRLQSAVDINEVSRINGLIALNEQNLQVHQQQTQNVALLLEAEKRVTEQRQEQMDRESAEILWMNSTPITDNMK